MLWREWFPEWSTTRENLLEGGYWIGINERFSNQDGVYDECFVGFVFLNWGWGHVSFLGNTLPFDKSICILHSLSNCRYKTMQTGQPCVRLGWSSVDHGKNGTSPLAERSRGLTKRHSRIFLCANGNFNPKFHHDVGNSPPSRDTGSNRVTTWGRLACSWTTISSVDQSQIHLHVVPEGIQPHASQQIKHRTMLWLVVPYSSWLVSTARVWDGREWLTTWTHYQCRSLVGRHLMGGGNNLNSISHAWWCDYPHTTPWQLRTTFKRGGFFEAGLQTKLNLFLTIAMASVARTDSMHMPRPKSYPSSGASDLSTSDGEHWQYPIYYGQNQHPIMQLLVTVNYKQRNLWHIPLFWYVIHEFSQR